jgi:hypothetical protein
VLEERLDNALTGLIRQWNIAEGRIKQAEQVRANEVVAAAIFELRYAGRKVVDAIHLALTEDWRRDAAVYDRIFAYIADATEDCVKAKHDAIDAMLDFVTSWFATVEKTLDLEEVQRFFPDYIKITASIAGIQDRIAESRRDRTKLRDSIYDEIEQNGEFAAILELYKRMLLSSERVADTIVIARRRETRMMRLHIAAVVLGTVALADILVRVLFYFMG